MAKRSGVVRPSWAWFALLDGGIVGLAVLSASEGTHSRVSDAVPTGLPPRRVLRGMLVGTAVIHAAEAVAAGRSARRRGLPARGWAFQTFLVGFPSLLALRRAPAA
ncbi:MAG TPA: DUF4499 domain-containing protein [Acidimicrobiales bacterium]